MIDYHSFKPKGTTWVNQEITYEFFCDSRPKKVEEKTLFIKQLGFVISHEYEITTNVNRVKQLPCSSGSCKDARKYKVELKVSVNDKIGIGFGFGGGTGTLGFTTKPRVSTEQFTTKCLCCDKGKSENFSKEVEEKPEKTVERLIYIYDGKSCPPNTTAVIVALSVLAVGTAVSLVYRSHDLANYFLSGMAFCILAAVTLILLRAASKSVAVGEKHKEFEDWDD